MTNVGDPATRVTAASPGPSSPSAPGSTTLIAQLFQVAGSYCAKAARSRLPPASGEADTSWMAAAVPTSSTFTRASSGVHHAPSGPRRATPR